ncbi:MAG: hypothetical protein BGP22_12785 [Variovorax sp. 67-131]|jgi:hypothetical protein|uniref:hypothetical protein n=1 Tax=unclassified Variovorax TaxID=663243 RepID=UPI00086E8DEB|nr:MULTISPECIES: hypothetical protein [unclassified Variovorax]MBN8751667.1 hypothetical protein [Variovorax sp.]ODU11962.1 MAG: hypothetical protein ABS94_35115 [Variovorax sp. SCN 67-85]ODV14676.1 MAG: hypothetical protein ABT25_32835 [Variovorax sp. SCN 67-20]OJZ05608.1 MAG: hypothetical protein BGP22_12785 [Variovorax sp. 67-131]
MKKLFFLALLTVSAAAMAQTTGGANNGSSSSATTSAQGNNQAVTFASPSNTTSSVTSTQNISNSGTTGVEYGGSYTIKNVPSVNGPNLTTSNDTCMGSTSASANGPGVGLSFGTTWTDEHCKRLKMSRELWNKGMKAASLAMDCMDPAAQAALEMTGTKCPQSMTADERVSAYGPQASSAGAPLISSTRPAAPAAPVAAAPVPVAPVAMAPPVPVPAPPPAPVAVVQPPPVAVSEPVVQPVAQAVVPPAAPPVEQPVAAAEPPAAIAMPVASATVMTMDANDVAEALRAQRLLSAEPVGDIATAPQSTTYPQ